ncbi:MAG: enoyl-CoA hydratase/isomerase family protein [Acidobacteriota bacterium]|nr:enoyl-CoA hydratase/isomerase family protein [Acidobacteriota bacterium]
MPARSEQREDICILTIDRPERANSIDLETALELSASLDRLAQDERTRVVVLTGAGGRVFCAGMDLKAVEAGLALEINDVPGGFAGIVRRDFPKPIIAAVEGAAIGGGFEIVLACDMVVAAEQARFGLPEVAHGLIAASGGLIRLPRRIPPALAVEMLLTGEPIGSARALELGLVNRVVPTGSALAAGLELAQTIAARDPAAVSASVRLARAVARGDEERYWASCAGLVEGLSSGREESTR